jgi:hypothetical protein
MGTISRRARASRFLVLIGVAVALAAPAAAADLTGTWSGGYKAIVDCDGRQEMMSGPISLYLTQSGSAVDGLGSMAVTVDCGSAQLFTLVFDVTGSVSGDGFTARTHLPGIGFGNITGMVKGESIAAKIFVPGGAGEAMLTRTSPVPPASNLTGAYKGTYSSVENVSDRCSNMTTLSYAGSLAGSFVQAGNAIKGEVVASGSKAVDPRGTKDCIVVDEQPEAISISGVIDGSSLNGVSAGYDDEDDPEPFAATVSGNTISGRDETTQFTLTRTSGTPAPVILEFTATPANIQPGGTSTLHWAVKNASLVFIEGIGVRPAVGSVAVSPSRTTTWTLSAGGGAVTATATVNVVAAPAVVILSDRPRGMLQPAGQAGATDSYTLTNVGGAETSITLTQNGSFFTQSLSSFSLKAGASQTVTLTALAQPAGVYEGSSAIAGTGVRAGAAIRVVLLSAGSPTGTADPRPEVRRRDVAAPAGTDPSGAISFTNRGTGTVEAVAVSDVEWLVPAIGRFTIAPGSSVSIPFTIRRALRPDGASPIGAVKGRFGLLFFGAPFAGAGKSAMTTVPVSKSLVTVVDVVKPGTSAAAPPPLAAGELALFVAGMSSRPGETGDLLVSSRSDSAISDLKIYYAATGATPSFLSGSVANLVANVDFALPGLVSNVFGKENQTGTVQLRSSTLAEIAVTGVQVDTSAGATSVANALPVFRSDRGAGAGEATILVGVEQSAAAATTLLVQEMTGAAATVQIDAFDAAGTAVGASRTASVGGFGLLELTDAVPTGAVSLRVRNTSTTTARIAAAAIVADAASGDAWTIVDAMFGLSLDEVVFVPLLAGLQRVGGAETELLFQNGGSTSQSVSVERHTTMPRRRTIPARGTAGAGSGVAGSSSQSLSIAPNQTVTSASTDGTAGYAMIAAASDVRSIGLMAFAPATGGGRVGSSLPAVPSSAALGLGEAMRFPGVEDASDATEAARTPGTYSSDLVLVETNGGETGVRITVRTTAAVSTTLTSTVVAAVDVTLAANRFYVIRDVVGTVLGAQRARYGDLTDVAVDVEVTSGTGRAIAFLQSIDNASRDVIVRTN